MDCSLLRSETSIPAFVSILLAACFTPSAVAISISKRCIRDRPYVVIYSTYPGASAEKVETSLTRILESSVSTTENLSNMSSISSDNLSLIILEFADDTNMDTAMLDLNAKIDLVKGYLDETISSPTLMAINPNMMPIMMATADYDGHDLQGLSDFVNEKVVPALEKTKGVASVDPTGLLEETVQIVLDHDKIDAINNKVLDSVDSELAKTCLLYKSRCV